MTENQLINSTSGNTLLKIEPIPGDINVYRRKSIQTIKTGPSIDPFIRQLPLLAAADQLGGAYKLIFPPGATGELVTLVNGPLKGLQTTTIRGTGAQFTGTAGLESLQALQAPLIAFVVMSAITGQYFQAKIENTLRRISEQIDKIIQMILAEKESDIRSIYHFTQYVTENIDVIKANDELRLSTLMNIQRNNINLYSLLKFYEKNIYFELDRMGTTGKQIKSAKLFTKSETAELKEEIENNSDFLERRQMCIDLYMMGRILEIQLASIFDKAYLSNFQKIIKEIDNNNTDLMNRVIDIHNDVFSIKSVREEKSISVGKLDSELRILKERKSYTAETIKNISLSVDEIISLDKNGIECLYCNNELHLLQS